MASEPLTHRCDRERDHDTAVEAPSGDIAAGGAGHSQTASALPGKQPHPRYPDRWRDGTVRPGNPGPALKDGRRSKLLQAHQAPRRRALRAQVLRSLSLTAKSLQPLLCELVDAFVETCVHRRSYASYLDTLPGVAVTARGNRRAAAGHHDEAVALQIRLTEAIRAEAEKMPRRSGSLAEYLESIANTDRRAR